MEDAEPQVIAPLDEHENAVILFDRQDFLRWWCQPQIGGTAVRVPAPDELHSPGVSQIAKERQRQIEEEDFGASHDSEHDAGELIRAAGCYIAEAQLLAAGLRGQKRPMSLAASWPWHDQWWKPSDDPVRNLEKAGALIAAEIDRLLRP